MKIYQAILGCETVHRNDTGRWVPSDIPDVVRIQSMLGGGNVTFALLCTEHQSFIYYAQTLDPQQASAPQLPIHQMMRNAASVTIGPLVVVDARRLVHASRTARTSTSAFARVNDAADTLPSCGPSGQVIADAIALTTGSHPIVTRVHVSSLTDDESAFTAIKAMLRQRTTDCDIDFTFLRESGVRVVNSCLRTIREWQALAVDINTLRDRLAAGDRNSALAAAQALLSEVHMRTLGRGLQHARSDSLQTSVLSVTCATLYFRCLAGGIATKLWCAVDVWYALKSSAGVFLSSFVGARAAYDLPLGIAYIKVLDALFEAEVNKKCIASLLVAPEHTDHKGFLKELTKEARVGYRDAHCLIKALEARKYSAISISTATKQERAVIYDRDFEYRGFNATVTTLEPLTLPGADTMSLVPAECLVELSEALCPAAFHQMEMSVLKVDLLNAMPSIPHERQRIARAVVASTVDEAWRKELPGERAPSSLREKVLESVGQRIGQQIADVIRPGRDRIVEAGLRMYVEWLDRHPNSANCDVDRVRASIVASAIKAYRTLNDQTDTVSEAATQTLASQGRQQASTSAQAQRIQRMAEAFAAQTTRIACEETRKAAAESASRVIHSRTKNALRNFIVERRTVESITQATLRVQGTQHKAIQAQVKAQVTAQTSRKAQAQKRETQTATARAQTPISRSASSGLARIEKTLSAAPQVPATPLGEASTASVARPNRSAVASPQ